MRYLTDEEAKLASRFLFLSMAITVIKKDQIQIQNGNFKIKEPYLKLLDQMTLIALKERKVLRKKMAAKRLRVIPHRKNDTFSSYLFLCNGKEEKRNYFNPAIRKKVEMIIQELIQKALSQNQPDAVANT